MYEIDAFGPVNDSYFGQALEDGHIARLGVPTENCNICEAVQKGRLVVCKIDAKDAVRITVMCVRDQVHV